MVAVASLKELPSGTSIAGYQTWSNLTFLHWRIAPSVLQPMLPDGLTDEEFDGSAWLGVVPFAMEIIRPWWSAAVPGVSWFLETNVRTYVRHDDGTSGVWFFSLDANSRLAVMIACSIWKLPYFVCRMSMKSTFSGHQSDGNGKPADTIAGYCYQGQRRDAPQYGYDIQVQFPPESSLMTADTGTLEHFLLERYVLFAEGPRGDMFRGDVHHVPYQFRLASLVHCQQTLTCYRQLLDTDQLVPEHIAFSPGVDVVVSPLQVYT